MAKQRQMDDVKGGFPEPWKPEQPGEKLEGIYLGHENVPERRGGTFTSYRIMNEETEELRSVSGAMLRTSLGRVPKGTFVSITFEGVEDQRNGEAKIYRVQCEKGTKLLPVADIGRDD